MLILVIYGIVDLLLLVMYGVYVVVYICGLELKLIFGFVYCF